MIRKLIPLNLQLFAEEGTPVGGEGAEATTFEINGQKMTGEQLADAYKKLQSHSTKVTQENSDLKKAVDTVKGWTDYDRYLTEIEAKTGQEVKTQLARMMDSFIESVAKGDAPSQAQMSQLGKEIDKAEKQGDDELVKRLEEMEAVAYEAQIEKTYSKFAKDAESEGYDFDVDSFNEFAFDYMAETFDLGEDDAFTTKQLQAAYNAYEAKMLKEARKKDIPPLSTSGGSSGPGKEKKKTKESLGDVSKRVLARLK